jgi:hypothetical protein
MNVPQARRTCNHIRPHLVEKCKKSIVTLAQPFMTVGSNVVIANIKVLIRMKIETQNTEYDTENFQSLLLAD